MKSILPLLVLLTFPAAAQHHVIQGKVREQSGKTINNVIVELWQAGARKGQSVSTSDGNFIFNELDAGGYEVIVDHVNYQRATERVEFRFGQSQTRTEIITVEILLRPKQTPVPPPATVYIQEVPPAARRAYENGLSKLKEGRTHEGTAFLREAVSIHPNYFSAQLALAGELSKGGDVQGALNALEVARRVNDSDGRVYHLFGILMAREKKYGVAEFAFREAIQRDPRNTQSYLSLATVLVELAIAEGDKSKSKTDLSEAGRFLNKALEMSENKLAAAYLQLARVHERQGNRKQAARDLETYLKLQPDDKNSAGIREAIAKLNK